MQLEAAESVVLMLDGHARKRLHSNQASLVMRNVEDTLQGIFSLVAQSRAQCQRREFEFLNRPQASPSG